MGIGKQSLTRRYKPSTQSGPGSSPALVWRSGQQERGSTFRKGPNAIQLCSAGDATLRAVRYQSPLVGLPLVSSAQREEDTLVLQLWKNLSGQQDVSWVTLELILPHSMGPLEKNQLAGSGAEFWI